MRTFMPRARHSLTSRSTGSTSAVLLVTWSNTANFVACVCVCVCVCESVCVYVCEEKERERERERKKERCLLIPSGTHTVWIGVHDSTAKGRA